MSTSATIASLNRQAAKEEANFFEVAQLVLDEGEPERIAEFFENMNIPRSTGSVACHEDMRSLSVTPDTLGDWVQEQAISAGIQKFMERHLRKLKWHSSNPDLDASENVMFVMRTVMAVTEMRLERLSLMLQRHDELSPEEWAIARELMNRSFLGIRNAVSVLGGEWIDTMKLSFPQDELHAKVADFYRFVDAHVGNLELLRERLESRRVEITVLPQGFPPVKPPRYFGGDLMDRGPWKHFWSTIQNHANAFREASA